jgi:CDP-diacylglycerol--serine O-phosphatidyltransferase
MNKLKRIQVASTRRIRENVANAITIANLSLGIFSILFVLQQYYSWAAFLILCAVLTDRLDGQAARKMNITSEFGKQLDSLCDLVSFGVAPAVLIYSSVLFEYGMYGGFVSSIYIICGAFRLAKFNILEQTDIFFGVPITVSGGFMALSYFMINRLPQFSFVVITVFLSILMVSNIRFRKM